MKKYKLWMLIVVVGLFWLSAAEVSAQRTKNKPKAKTPAKAKTVPVSEKTGAVKNGEPTEEEMKQAVIRSLQKRGATKRGENSVSVDNAIAGSSYRIEEFEKLGCKPANYGAGYFCTYGITTSLKMYSNEGSEAGDRHSAAVNMLMRTLTGGRDSLYDTVTSRFIRTKQGWIMSRD